MEHGFDRKIQNLKGKESLREIEIWKGIQKSVGTSVVDLCFTFF